MDAATVANMTSYIDFSSIISGLGMIAASLMLLQMAINGSRWLLKMLRYDDSAENKKAIARLKAEIAFEDKLIRSQKVAMIRGTRKTKMKFD